MQLINFFPLLIVPFTIASPLSLTFRNSANETTDHHFTLSKRDDPFRVDAFKGSKPTGDPVEIQNAKAGQVINLALDCGTIVVTSHTADVTTCNFMLPSTLPAGTFTGAPAAGHFTLQVPGSCSGAVTQVSAANICTVCGDIGEIPNLIDCHGKEDGKDNVNVCVSGTTLVEC